MSKIQFLNKWFKNPLRMGSVIPSNKRVGYAFANNIDLNKKGFIIEIGAGTGTVTQSLIEKGIPEHRIVCVEIDKDFCTTLQKKFPNITVINDNIMNLHQLLKDNNIDQINAFVSTLPLVSLGKQMTMDIFALLKPFIAKGASYLQMSYSPFFTSKSKKLGIHSTKCGYIFNNFPPAYIYKSVEN